jgi:hypothetical protein
MMIGIRLPRTAMNKFINLINIYPLSFPYAMELYADCNFFVKI